MASAQVQHAPRHLSLFEPLAATEATEKHHVRTQLNYYKDPGDGSEPAPTYIGKPETYERPAEPLDVTVYDIRGEEAEFTVERQGFQLYNHTSAEKFFVDDEKIKREYYPETEQLLKDA